MDNLLRSLYLIKYTELSKIFQDCINTDKTAVVYMDAKNIFSFAHSEESMKEVVKGYTSKTDRYMVLRNILAIANHYARFFKRNGVKFKLYFFDDRGTSLYHKNIDKNYKANRIASRQKLSEIFIGSVNLMDSFVNIYDKSVQVANDMFKFIDEISFVNLTHLESDFVPYFLMREHFMDPSGKFPSNDYVHYIFSNDKDFQQLLVTHNIYQITKRKHNQPYLTLNNQTALGDFIKRHDVIKKLNNATFIPLLLAIAGDTADNVNGVPGIGYLSGYSVLNSLYESGVINLGDSTAEAFLLKLKEYVKINSKLAKNNKIISILNNEDKIINNFKLTSFKKCYESLDYSQKKEIKDKYAKNAITAETNAQLYANFKNIFAEENSFKFLISYRK